ncbi:MAG TPA: NAD(P)-binding protein [Acidimicrobiales bacterium]
MREIEADYLVVGAGASGMAFVDVLVAEADVDVVLVDRRHGPGGHWLDAYPFVRLHQASANYGVNSRTLGNDRVDDSGTNAGFYERATAAEIVDYFRHVLDDLVASGRVRFFGMSDYRGWDGDGHRFVSLLTGAETKVTVRRKVVDATYVESTIPSRHTPAFEADPGVRLVSPNDLVDLHEPASGFTVIGAGKTAMDTCNWLLDAGVDPDRIEWIRCRDPWIFNREFNQPLERVGAYMQLQARFIEAAAEVGDSRSFAHHLEAGDVLMRIDPNVEPEAFRGAILSVAELESLRRIERVVRHGRVLRIGTDRVDMQDGSVASDPHRVFVDCTAAGVRPTVPLPVFDADRITLQYVTLGIVPWSAATLGVVEASRDDEADKNRLCPPLTFTGNVSDLLRLAHTHMVGQLARSAEPDLAAWTEGCRLNPSRGALDHLDDPRVPAAFASLGSNIGAAMANLSRIAATPPSSQPA